MLLPVLSPLFCVCCFSIVETKGTRGRCGGAWAQPCSASCLTGSSSTPAVLGAEVEQDGGEAAAAWKGRRPLVCHLGVSPRTWTPHGTVLSNTGLFFYLEKEDERVAAGRRQTNFYTRWRALFFFSFFPKRMPRCSDGPCWYFDKAVVLSLCTVRCPCLIFLHFQHLSNSDGLHGPWECLTQRILPEWVFLKLLTGKIAPPTPRHPPCVFQHQIETIYYFLLSKEGIFSEPEPYYITPHCICWLHFPFFSAFIFLFVRRQIATQSLSLVGQNISSHGVGQQRLYRAFLQFRATCQTIHMLCSRQHSG